MTDIDVMDDIRALPAFSSVTCPGCKSPCETFALETPVRCPDCGTEWANRGYAGIGSEIQDVIDQVLAWLSDDRSLQEALRRRKVVLSSDAEWDDEADEAADSRG